jgi:hypothetical protein
VFKTPAVTASATIPTPVSQTVPIVILGSDALLAASPATPVQLAHACMRAGFANVVPISWGDELIAGGVLRRLPDFGAGPAIHCSCPIVAHRLLTVGGDLRPALLALVPPPVAVARYVKAVMQSTPIRLTYVGACPGAVDDSIDIRMTPEALIAMLAEREIHLLEQPRVFESVIPPDRRRYLSQPGGLPSADLLWNQYEPRSIVELEGDDIASELAQQLLTGKNVLIDVSARLGCVCSGAVPGAPLKDVRANVAALEPPRASLPVIEDIESIVLDQPVPAAPRTPVDVVAVPYSSTPPKPAVFTPPPNGATPFGHRISPVRSLAAIAESRPPRISSPNNARPIVGNVPVARDAEGKSLPRAYVARRRLTPRGFQAIVNPTDEPAPRAGSALLTPPSGVPIIEPSTPPIDPPLAQLQAAELAALNPRHALHASSTAPSVGPVIVTVNEPAKHRDTSHASSSSPQARLADLPLLDLNAGYASPSDTVDANRPSMSPRSNSSDVSMSRRDEPTSHASSTRSSSPQILGEAAAPTLIFPGSGKQTVITVVAALIVALSIGVVVAVVVARSLH